MAAVLDVAFIEPPLPYGRSVPDAGAAVRLLHFVLVLVLELELDD